MSLKCKLPSIYAEGGWIEKCTEGRGSFFRLIQGFLELVHVLASLHLSLTAHAPISVAVS